MAAAKLDDEIALLYQLPLAEFTAARNLLAKRAGARAADVRTLQKPQAAAWAVNQVFWRDRAVYDQLIEAAGDFRAAHAAVLAGKRSDVRAAGKTHEEAINAAIKSALAILKEDGHPATDATRQAIATTLRALPGSDPPGQLTGTLQPGGFEMLAGLQVSARAAAPREAPARPAAAAAGAKPSVKVDEAAKRRAREEVEEADRAVRLAEHAAHREAFEAARAAREVEKAAKAVTAAREAVEEASRMLADAEAVAAAATAAKDAAAARAAEADTALHAARDHARTLRRPAVGQ